MVDTGYSMPVIQAYASPWTNGAVPELQKISRAMSIAIISGVSERDGASIYNSQVFINQDGKIVNKYRKTHLFTAAPIEEHQCFSPGNEFISFAFAGLRFGLSIYYDLGFRRYIENSPQKITSTLLSFLPRGPSRALNICER